MWATSDRRLDFDDGEELVRRRKDATWSAGLSEIRSSAPARADPQEAPAQRVALKVVLPGWKSLISGICGWDVEERSARVVATALDVISRCASEPAEPSELRIYTSTRRRVLRAAIRARSEPRVVLIRRRFGDGGCALSVGSAAVSAWRSNPMSQSASRPYRSSAQYDCNRPSRPRPPTERRNNGSLLATTTQRRRKRQRRHPNR